MLKKLFILLFIMFISTNIFAESHDIHNQITGLTERVNQLEHDVKEEKIDKLSLVNKDINVTIKNDFEPLINKLNEKNIKEKSFVETFIPLSTSDWGTAIIAILTILLTLYAWRNFKELEKQNKQNLDYLRKEEKRNEDTFKLNHLENQILYLRQDLDITFNKREFNTHLVSVLESRLSLTNKVTFENHVVFKKGEDEFFITKGNFFTYLNFLDIDLRFEKTYVKDILKEVRSLNDEMTIFSFKLTNLIIQINKAFDVGYDLDAARNSLGVYYSYAKKLYQYGVLDVNTYEHFKIILAGTTYISKDININLKKKFIEEIKVYKNNFEESNIKDIKWFTERNTDEILVKFEILLKDGIVFNRDEKGNWNFDK